MNLEVIDEGGKFFVVDKETGERLNNGKPFPSRQGALVYMRQQMGAEKLGKAGKQLMPPPGAGDPMAALMGGGAPMAPGAPGGMMPGMMDKMRMKPPMPGM